MTKDQELLRAIILRAIDAEGLPVPAIWRHNLTELCYRVIAKLIGTDAVFVAYEREDE